MAYEKHPKVLLYYSSNQKAGGPLTYINTIIHSELRDHYDFATCFQNCAPGGLDLKLLRRMTHEIKMQAPDIVHVQGLQSEGLYGVAAAKLAGCRHIITTVHGFAFDNRQAGPGKRWIYRHVVEPLTIRMSDRVYCVCNYAERREIIRKHAGLRNAGTIYNPAPKMQAVVSRDALRNELGIGTSEIVFIIAARLVADKGFPLLEEAVKIINRAEHRFRLLVLGNGGYRATFESHLQAEIKSRQVILVGQTDRVADYLNAADVFVLPSLHENLPISILEAAEFGLPSVASAVGGIPEIVNDGETGFLISTQTPEDYAKKMIVLIRDAAMREQFRNNIRSELLPRFSIKSFCTQIDRLYQDEFKYYK